MKKFIIGFLLGSLLFGGIAHAYRATRPTPMRLPLDDNQIAELNNSIESLWNITNGKFSPNSGSVASTGTGTVKMGSINNADSAGWLKFEKSDGTNAYVPYWTDDTP